MKSTSLNGIHAEFELVDVSKSLPELKRRPGLTNWRPTIGKSINTDFESYDDFIKSLPASDPSLAETKMSPGHWPPSNAAQLGLERWYVWLSRSHT